MPHDVAREIFGKALELDEERRIDFVREACKGNDALRAEVEALVRLDGEASALEDRIRIETPISLSERRSDVEAAPPGAPRWSLPGFTVVKKIGEGGIGVVYEARQHTPARRVAIKVLRDDVRSERALRRFEFEGQVLARLNHPGIARVFETGTVDVDGGRRPYLVMERVDGIPITELVTRRGLSIEDRVRLMIRVCHAVQNAHQKGVLHRDLKPGNILVDTSGQPRIVDFGTARIESAESKSWHTATAEIIGTIRYMSPEQLEGRSEEIDARSDIYALGVVFYEILAGRLPHDSSGSAFHQLARSICEEDPVPLGRVDRALGGDLEAIVQTALEKRPEDRYASASALADDLGRMLRHEVVQARPMTSSYRLRKLVRRQRTLVTAAAIILVALVGAAAVSFDQWRRAAHARDEVVLALDFFDSIFEAIGNTPGGRDSLVVDYLEMASSRVEESFALYPGMQARLHESFGNAYEHLGEYESAAGQLAESLRIQRELHGERDAKTLQTMTTLGGLLHLEEKHDEADTLLREAFELAGQALPPSDPVVSLTEANWAWFLARRGRLDEAEAPALGAVDKRRRYLGERDRATLFSTSNLAALRHRQERLEEAAGIFERVLPLQEEILGGAHRDTLTSRANLTAIYHRLGWNDRAVDMQEEIVESFRSSFGADHPKTLVMMENLGAMYVCADRPDDAIDIWTAVVDTYSLGDEPHPRIANVLGPLAQQLTDRGRNDEARRTLAHLARVEPPDPHRD